ncbi:hypothetical protein ACJZ2D_013354 [Fusarium nematophilum]
MHTIPNLGHGARVLNHARKYLDRPLPRSWRLSNLPIGHFILKSNKTYGDSVVQVSDSQRDKDGVCINGEMWVLTSAPNPNKHCGYSGDTSSCLGDFKDVPEADKLNSDVHRHQNKGKRSMEDPPIISQMESILDPMVESPANSIFKQIRNNGIRARGVIDIPVCDWKEVVKN